MSVIICKPGGIKEGPKVVMVGISGLLMGCLRD